MTHTWNIRLLLTSGILLLNTLKSNAQQIPYENSAELIEKGIEQHDKGNYNKALEWYRKVPEGDTNYLLSVYEQALTLMTDTNYQECITLARKAIREGYSDKRQLLLNIANATDEMGKPEEALLLYDSCTALYPHDNRPYYEKAVIYFKKKDYPAAIQLLQQSLLRNPYHYRSHYMLGNIYTIQGRLSEAVMALQASLLCANDRNMAEGPINSLSAIAVQNDEVTEFYNNRQAINAHPLYDEIDEIIHAKLALNKGYTLKTPIDDKIIRQLQVVMEKLRYDSRDTTFSMQYYVPLFKEVYDKDQFEAYVLLLFSDYGIEAIDKMATARKGKARLEEIRGLVYPYLNTIRSTRVLHYTQRQTAPELYNHFAKENLLVVGKYADQTSKKLAEGQVQYYKEQALVAEGRYDASGQKDGTWNYYYPTAKLKLKEQYKNGKLTGEATSWYANGNTRYTIKYNADGEVAERQNYEYSGRAKSKSIRKGKEEYEVTYYNADGSVMRVLRMINDKIKDGSYSQLYPNGKVRKEITYKNDKQDGPCKAYYDNDSLKESYTYKENKVDGTYLSFFRNGQPDEKYHYIDGKKNGDCEDYYETGGLYRKSNFANDKEDGLTTFYDHNGKAYGWITYKEGKAIAVKYIDPDGKVILEKEDRKGITPFDYYDSYGSRRSHIPMDEKGNAQGKASYYFTSGILKEETSFSGDERDGPSVVYSKNGKVNVKRQYKKGQEDGYYQSYFPNGALSVEGWIKEGQSQGTWHNYAPNGKLTRDFFMIDGVLNGPEKNYESNGKLDYINHYDYGMITGLSQYDSTGKLLQETTFDKGNGQYRMLYFNGNPGLQCALKYGNLEGPYTIHTPDKKLLEKGNYAAGRRDGECTTYYPNGKVRLKGNYNNGQRTGNWIVYDVAGNLESETAYQDGDLHGMDHLYAGVMLRYATNYYNDNKHGAMTIYGEDQKVAGILFYDMGLLTGYTYEGKDGKQLPVIPITKGTAAIRTFYASGAKALEFNFTNNCYDGSQKLFYSNGQLAEEREFKENDYHGAYKRFNQDGSKLLEMQYVQDLQQGPEKKYDNKGRLLSSCNYTDGRPNGPAKIIDGNGKDMIDIWYYYGTLQ